MRVDAAYRGQASKGSETARAGRGVGVPSRPDSELRGRPHGQRPNVTRKVYRSLWEPWGVLPSGIGIRCRS